jgi:hypothetical protein
VIPDLPGLEAFEGAATARGRHLPRRGSARAATDGVRRPRRADLRRARRAHRTPALEHAQSAPRHAAHRCRSHAAMGGP